MLEIELNGAAHTLPGESSLHDLVESLGLAGQKLALAVNRQVVPRERWRDTLLSARDRVDVVRAIGGG
ncbi:sulfur carrier protein ThiS [Massilia rhizosphaerae]|uniref:sulfur carrier protein ThiS n=1 Tax=Massilia rhizosphaerae TaxID=2784389 RepID=UPI0018DBAF4D